MIMEPSSLLVTMMLVATALAAMSIYFRRQYSYWARRGVPSPAAAPLVGNFGAVLLGRKNNATLLADLAAAHRDVGYCGIYQFDKPALLVWDPEMVKQIVIKDFSSFHDRNFRSYPSDPLSQSLVGLRGQQWKNLRSQLTPAFSSGKIKAMLPLMCEVAEDLVSQLAPEAEAGREVDMEDLLARFATDVVGTVAFGIRCNSLRDQDSEFRAMSKGLFKRGPAVNVIYSSLHPALAKLVPMKLLLSKATSFFLDLMRDQVEQREQAGCAQRNDFVEQMMLLRAADKCDDDADNNVKVDSRSSQGHIKVTTSVMAAQAFIFFYAGLGNISNTTGYILNALAGDQALQERLAGEVREVLKQHGGELSYEALKKMSLVCRTVLEGLRLWNPMGIVIRQCNATTRLGPVVVEKGQSVFIASKGIHMDARVYPDPERFDPDRHTAEEREKRHPCSFLPFGEGPRMCIAERFALLELEMVLATLVHKFCFSPGPNFERKVEIDMRGNGHRPKNGFRLRVTERR